MTFFFIYISIVYIICIIIKTYKTSKFFIFPISTGISPDK